jgi:hypothetical protein
MNEWSPTALSACLLCGLVFTLTIMGGCTYVVFWLNQSGAWYILALIIAGGWSCKSYRSPAQIASDPPEGAE